LSSSPVQLMEETFEGLPFKLIPLLWNPLSSIEQHAIADGLESAEPRSKGIRPLNFLVDRLVVLGHTTQRLRPRRGFSRHAGLSAFSLAVEPEGAHAAYAHAGIARTSGAFMALSL
jgi:hypothetical protein